MNNDSVELLQTAQGLVTKMKNAIVASSSPIAVLEPLPGDEHKQRHDNFSDLINAAIQHLQTSPHVVWTEFEPDKIEDALKGVLLASDLRQTGTVNNQPLDAVLGDLLLLFRGNLRAFSNWSIAPSFHEPPETTQMSPLFPNALLDVGVVVLSDELLLFVGQVMEYELE